MTGKPLGRLATVACAAALVLAGCQSDEDRASEYFTSGEALLAEGDLPRAVIQFRNALRLDPEHAEAREAVARALQARGDYDGAQREFLTLSEQFPTDVSLRRALGEIALVKADWTSLERYADEAERISPGAEDARTLRLAVAYRRAASERDRARQDLIAHEALGALESSPADPILLRIVVQNLAQGSDPMAALPVLDRALQIDPHVPELQIMRIRLLAEGGALDLAEDRLLDLVALYPQDAQIAGILASRYLSKGDTAAAEEILRGLAEGAPRTDTSLRLTLVRFLERVYGLEAALAELERFRVEADGLPSAALYGALARALRFDAGEQDGAVADLDHLLTGIDETAEGLRIRILKARFEDRLGNQDAARALVEAVLAVDPGNLGALKLRGEWLLDLEHPKPAVVALRTALAQAPRDVEVMNLLAAAHMMDGNRALAMEQLAVATDVSNHAARESERYARALVENGRIRVAQRVLEAAQANAPADTSLATTLAGLYVDQRDWSRAAAMANLLAEIGSREALDAVAPIQAAILEGQGNRDAALGLMERLLDGGAAAGDQAYRAPVLVVQTAIRRGDLNAARAYLNHALEQRPEVVALRLLDASLHRHEGDLAGAEAILQQAMVDAPSDAVVHSLFQTLYDQARLPEAEAVLADGLERFPGSRLLRLVESNRLEAAGDVRGAIGILATLHAEDPRDLPVANNLASLISVHSDDPDELDRAAAIAANLQAESLPAVADTVGWLAFRRGDIARALPLMERASRGLPRDLGVQLRMGQVYAAAGETARARDVLEFVARAEHPLAQQAEAQLAALEPGVPQ